MTSFIQYVQQLALSDQLPFSIGKIEPLEDEGIPTASVSGFIFQIHNELLAREHWFFEKIVEANTKRYFEILRLQRELGKKFKAALGLETTVQKAIALMFDPTPEIRDNPLYEEFEEENTDTFLKIGELGKLIQSDSVINWLKITFFINSRAVKDWDLSDTASLKSSQIQPILDLILKETNGGVVPEPVMTNIEETSEGEPEKNAPSRARTGRKSSGKLVATTV